MTIRQFLFA